MAALATPLSSAWDPLIPTSDAGNTLPMSRPGPTVAPPSAMPPQQQQQQQAPLPLRFMWPPAPSAPSPPPTPHPQASSSASLLQDVYSLLANTESYIVKHMSDLLRNTQFQT